MSFNRLIPAVSVVVAAVTAAGCDSTENPYTGLSYEPPANVRQATMVWSAEAGIDLFGHPSTLARAATEAGFVATYAGIDESYPGFAEAVGDEFRAGIEDARMKGDSALGTYRSRVMSTTETPTGFLAEICETATQTVMVRNGTGIIIGEMPSRKTVEFTSKATNPPNDRSIPEPPSEQDYPIDEVRHWVAPEFDVFRGWAINTVNDAPDLLSRCNEWQQTINATPPKETEPPSIPEPEILPAYPGWPQ